MDLVCFAHAGASARLFAPWQRSAKGSVRVVPVERPGFGMMLGQPPATDWTVLLDHVCGALPRSETADLALFGHSLGALVAFGVAHRLQDAGTPPALLAVGGANGPPVARRGGVDWLSAPRSWLVARLQELGGMPDILLEDAALLDVLEPGIRADFHLAATFRFAPGPLLRCQVHALAGEADPLVDAPGLAAWTAVTAERCRVTRLPGGHFLSDLLRDHVLADVASRAARQPQKEHS